tara:strand:+ start:30 stop:536 length:507 start_codon:yes stop_codon:yes gene_type:complete
MEFYIVTGRTTLDVFKRCRYFRQNLGMVSTVDKNGSRLLNDKDKFSFYFNSLYKTTIYANGNVGDVKFYHDAYINDKSIGIYIGSDGSYDEFIFEYDKNLEQEKGIDNYIGYLLKESETEYEVRKEEEKIKRETPKPVGNSQKLSLNPGNVTYEDILAYKKGKNKKRF